MGATAEEQDRIRQIAFIQGKEMLTVSDLCLLTGFKPNYVRNLANQGKIPYYKPFGKCLFFKKSEIEDILQRSKVII